MAAENDFIGWLTAQARRDPRVVLGIGDDLAALKLPGSDLLLAGVDQVLDGVHVDSRIHTPRQIGRKAMNRNLSDCAAMACVPVAALAGVALPEGCGGEYARELYAGLREAADPYHCIIIGGDTGSWQGKLVVTVTILGSSQGIEPVTRSGARPGDRLYVTGPLGGSILSRHMSFEPRVTLARELARAHKLTAMIDLSDGLSRDLSHICRQSGVGAVIDAESIPIHPDARVDRHDGRNALEHALHDGEDYELLIASAEQLSGCVCIGRFAQGADVLIRREGKTTPLEPLAWEYKL